MVVEANKVEIVREGAVPPLLSLSHSTDVKVQRNAAGALLNLTHVGKQVGLCGDPLYVGERGGGGGHFVCTEFVHPPCKVMSQPF